MDLESLSGGSSRSNAATPIPPEEEQSSSMGKVVLLDPGLSSRGTQMGAVRVERDTRLASQIS